MKQIFKDDKKGETSLDIVRAICRTVKSKNFNVSPAVGYYNIQMHREIGYFHIYMYFHQILKINYRTHETMPYYLLDSIVGELTGLQKNYQIKTVQQHHCVL